MRALREWCEACGRRVVRHGKVCRKCEARVQAELARARRLMGRMSTGNLVLAYRGTVRDLRARALPELRRAGMRGLTPARNAPAVQRALNRLMKREALAEWAARA